MVSSILRVFKRGKLWLAASSLMLVAACDDLPIQTPNLPNLNLGGPKTAQVALLVPKGSADGQVNALAASAEAAARLAVADAAENVKIDLRVYATAGDATQAAAVAQQAVAEGAEVIVGPLFAEAANAAGLAVAASGVNVLSLSNNVDIAGGNVYVLGNTFQNTANRLVGYAARQGKKRAIVVHARNVAGEAGRAALVGALSQLGVSNAGVEGYDFSQEGVLSVKDQVAKRVSATGADVLLLTSDYAGALGILAQILPEAGVNPSIVQYAGITRWDASPAAFNLPGIQGGWFALPNPDRIAAYEARYQAAYGSRPHPLSAIAFDGVAAVAASVASGGRQPLSGAGLTRAQGFEGASGAFRLNSNGTVERSMAIATIQGNNVVVIEGAPTSFSGL